MYDLDYVDETIIEECKKSFKSVYPEFIPYVLGASRDRTCIIVECEMLDGTFYFRVTENSVSSSYNTAEDADRA